MSQPPKRERKGTFGPLRLPIAGRYVLPASRRRMIMVGLLLAGIVLVFAAIGLVRRSGPLAAGPLSSGHAVLQTDCAACHQPFGAVTQDACSSCHEQVGHEVGVYSFATHYLYGTSDFQRVVPSPDEVSCAACHTEHLGRDAQITAAPDRSCTGCHETGGFARDHPDFEIHAAPYSDDAGLIFGHAMHVHEVADRSGALDLERACLYCHVPTQDGKAFEAIDFDRSCDACHLTADLATTRLPARDPSDPASIGVDTLDTILARGGPDSQWALFANPGEYRQVGRRVSKSPLHHGDPWILANLRNLRRQLYPDAGLADLLVASGEVEPDQLRLLYREAIETLEGRARGLRNQPDPALQAELTSIDGVLEALRIALRDPYTPLDETAFLLALDAPRAELTSEQVDELETLIGDLTQHCSTCHVVEKATIGRVQKDQRTFRRAHFDHAAHALQSRCMDCHGAIPIPPLGETVVDDERDRAEVHNLPRIELCRTCHTPSLASDSCATCHFFHPDKTHRTAFVLDRGDTLESGP